MPDPTSPYPPAPTTDHYLAWAELVGYMRASAKHGDEYTAEQVLNVMQELHERYGLPPENAPKRTEATS